MVRKLIARFAAYVLRKTRPTTELLQIRLRGSGENHNLFQLAQRRFLIGGDEGEKLQWLSQMIGRSSIPDAEVEVVRENDDRFLVVESSTEEFGPSYLTDRRPA